MQVVRVRLGRDEDKAALLAGKLTRKLDDIWASPVVRPLDVPTLLSSVTPRVLTFDDAVELYLENRRAGRGADFVKVVRIRQGVVPRKESSTMTNPTNEGP